MGRNKIGCPFAEFIRRAIVMTTWGGRSVPINLFTRAIAFSADHSVLSTELLWRFKELAFPLYKGLSSLRVCSATHYCRRLQLRTLSTPVHRLKFNNSVIYESEFSSFIYIMKYYILYSNRNLDYLVWEIRCFQCASFSMYYV